MNAAYVVHGSELSQGLRTIIGALIAAKDPKHRRNGAFWSSHSFYFRTSDDTWTGVYRVEAAP